MRMHSLYYQLTISLLCEKTEKVYHLIRYDVEFTARNDRLADMPCRESDVNERSADLEERSNFLSPQMASS
jgi:hypothetical protein